MAYDGPLRHPYQGKIYTQIERPLAEHIEIVRQTYTGFVVDRLGKHGVMHHSLKPLDRSMKICGSAITVLGPDLALRRMAADLAQPGDVLVIAAGGTVDYGLFGDGTALKMSLRGVQGVVIDGSTRDAQRIVEMGFPCFCKGVNLRNYDYPVFARFGAVNVPVSVGGTIVNPGDLIFGDADGVLVVPRAFVPLLAQNIQEQYTQEAVERVGLGKDFSFDVKVELLQRGYEFINERSS
jgi:4-hydroxy-4-methyl-2-oxoglutarate aldolase